MNAIYTPITIPSNVPLTLISPSGKERELIPFVYQPLRFDYNEMGLETITNDGEAQNVVRFTPDESGDWRIGDQIISVSPDESAHGYIGISKRDPRYFAYSDGTPCFPIGINLCYVIGVSLSGGREFQRSGRHAFIGMRQFERWFRQCQKNGVDLVRIWLGNEYTCPDTDEAGVLDPVQLSKLDHLVALAKSYGIRIKLTLEQFRYLSPTPDKGFFNKYQCKNGRICQSVDEWLTDPLWRAAWLEKVRQLAVRLADDPTIFAIELWNEQNAMNELSIELLVDWNKYMLAEVHKLFPKNMVINSLGSYDCEWADRTYQNFCWDSSDIVQLHRYLDLGAGLEECRGDLIDLVSKGSARLARNDKPLMVAETGGVNNNHTGPFPYYAPDHDGIILSDLNFAPVFCGAASNGHMWHWDNYVEQKNLFRLYKPLSQLCDGIAFDSEGFVSEQYRNEEVTLLLLRGRTVTLGYLRNRSDSWQNILRDLGEAKPYTGEFEIELEGKLEIFPYQNDENGTLRIGKSIEVDNLSRGLLFKVTH